MRDPSDSQNVEEIDAVPRDEKDEREQVRRSSLCPSCPGAVSVLLVLWCYHCVAVGSQWPATWRKAGQKDVTTQWFFFSKTLRVNLLPSATMAPDMLQHINKVSSSRRLAPYGAHEDVVRPSTRRLALTQSIHWRQFLLISETQKHVRPAAFCEHFVGVVALFASLRVRLTQYHCREKDCSF